MVISIDIDTIKLADVTQQTLIEELWEHCPPMHRLVNIEAVRPSANIMGTTVFVSIERLMDGDQYLLF